ncbi:MAG: hypothetical protein JO069_06740 [Verrucomicrobia bacterium]|nr:hypothetical protein [Verrucomicrobiota bacterium]
MNKPKTFGTCCWLLTIIVGLASLLTGCASMEASNKESLLIAAGFRSRTPSTQAQVALYNRMTPYRVERRTRKGKVVYTFVDKKKGVVYIGGENEYQRYKQLGLQQSIAQNELEAAEINQEAAVDWDWGPWGLWW